MSVSRRGTRPPTTGEGCKATNDRGGVQGHQQGRVRPRQAWGQHQMPHRGSQDTSHAGVSPHTTTGTPAQHHNWYTCSAHHALPCVPCLSDTLHAPRIPVCLYTMHKPSRIPYALRHPKPRPLLDAASGMSRSP